MSGVPRTLVQHDGAVSYRGGTGAWQPVGIVRRDGDGWAPGGFELRRDAVAALVASAIDVGVVLP